MTVTLDRDIATMAGRLAGKNAIVTGAAGYVPFQQSTSIFF